MFPMKILSLTLLVCGLSLGAGQFKLDDATLLLNSFDGKNPYVADFANGNPHFGGMGARQVDGYYGKGLDISGLQFERDFVNKGTSHNARFDGFCLPRFDNINYYQGTFEFWFKLPVGKVRPNPRYSTYILQAVFSYMVQNPGDKRHSALLVNLNSRAISYLLPFLNGRYHKGALRFKHPLKPGLWHHLALCWSPGEFTAFLDGKIFMSLDMTGAKGFALASQVIYPINMSGVILDELRISDTVRYQGSFEPNWKNGVRPQYAWDGVSGVQRHPARTYSPYRPAVIKTSAAAGGTDFKAAGLDLRFNQKNGSLIRLRCRQVGAGGGMNGLIIHEGVANKLLKPLRVINWRQKQNILSFQQIFEDGIEAGNILEPAKDALRWTITFTNNSDRERWIEPKLSIPLPFGKVLEYFDGSDIKKQFPKSYRGESFFYTMPFCAAFGNRNPVGIAMDPREQYNAPVNELIPSSGATPAVMRQGLKMALAPKESYTVKFYLVTTAKYRFGVIDAIAKFHDMFPELYRRRPELPVFSYMNIAPVSRYQELPELWRQTYVGTVFRQGPSHGTDLAGHREFWNNPAYFKDPTYRFTRKREQLWGGSLDNMHETIRTLSRNTYDQYYPVGASWLPAGVLNDYMVKALWPGHTPEGDPLVLVQSYAPPINKDGKYFVNEKNTPLGKFIKRDVADYFDLLLPFSTTVINTKGQYIAMRFNDEIAQKTPGRAYSRDRGTYVHGDAGRMDRYREHTFGHNSKGPRVIWSAGGQALHSLCVYSAAVPYEGFGYYQYHNAMAPQFAASRYMLGEKPLLMFQMYFWDFLPLIFKPQEFTPASLRDYFRYRDSHLFLQQLKNGSHLEPVYLCGRLEMVERYPILAESIISGRQTHPGAKVAPPLWLVRGGRGAESLLVAANQSPQAQSSDIEIFNTYYSGVPLFAEYFGGNSKMTVSPETTIIPAVKVKRRDLRAFKCVGILCGKTSGSVATDFSGDGLTMQLQLKLQLSSPVKLQLNTFAPIYEISSCSLNGRKIEAKNHDIELAVGKNQLELKYQNRILDFSEKDFRDLDLLKNSKVNFRLIADRGKMYVNKKRPGTWNCMLGFENGTAMMLKDFFEQYDEENGVYGDIGLETTTGKIPAGYSGWKVRFLSGKSHTASKVRINRDKHELIFSGPSEGQVRLAMVVFLRLLERKYPHVGRIMPLHSARRRPFNDLWKTVRLSAGGRKEFYEHFPEKDFLRKPLLKAEHEALYKNGNHDFTGKYRTEYSPYLYEPTCVDTFVYGRQ